MLSQSPSILGIMRCQYQSYGLVDMCIHDITVVADLTRSNPNPPAPGEDASDGTCMGLVDELEPSPATTMSIDFIEGIANQVSFWWEGWWPRVHASISFVTPAGSDCSFHCSVDLLFDFRLESLYLETPASKEMTSHHKEDWATQVAESLFEEGTWQGFHRGLAQSMIFMLFGISALLTVPATGTAALNIILACILLSSIWQFSLFSCVELGLISVDFALAIILMWMNSVLGTIIPAFGSVILFMVIGAVKVLKIKDMAWGVMKIKTTIYSFALNFLLALQYLIQWILMAEESTQTYMDASIA